MQAIILAGGFGTRLRTVITDLPKPLAPIQGKPFLAHLLDYLHAQGITRVILSVHFMHEKIQSYFQSSYRGISIDYAIEEQPLGTGGAILNSLSLVDPKQPVFVLNGDTFLKLNYQTLMTLHQTSPQTSITMTLRFVPDASRYGLVLTKGNQVIAFQERGGQEPGCINAGVYLINPYLFETFSLSRAFSFEKEFLFPEVNQLKPLALVVDDYFIDIGVPEDYARAMREFSNDGL